MNFVDDLTRKAKREVSDAVRLWRHEHPDLHFARIDELRQRIAEVNEEMKIWRSVGIAHGFRIVEECRVELVVLYMHLAHRLATPVKERPFDIYNHRARRK